MNISKDLFAKSKVFWYILLLDVLRWYISSRESQEKMHDEAKQAASSKIYNIVWFLGTFR